MIKLRPDTAFEAFVGTHGVDRIAMVIGVTVFSVYHYLRGSRRMRPKKEKKLLTFAAGALSATDLNDHYDACIARARLAELEDAM